MLLLRQIEPALTILEASDCDTALGVLESRADIDQVILDLTSCRRALEALVLFSARHPDIPVVALGDSAPPTARSSLACTAPTVFIPGSSPSSSLRAGLNLGSGERHARAPAYPANKHSQDDRAEHRGGTPGIKTRTISGRFSARLEEAGLTSREQQVLLRALDGAPYKTVGAALSIQEQTVRHHMSRCLKKLKVKTREQLIALFASEVDRPALDNAESGQSPLGYARKTPGAGAA